MADESFDEFVRDKAAAWASVNDHEYASVDAFRGFASVDALRGLSLNDDLIVGKTMEGYPEFGHGMKKLWPFADDCEYSVTAALIPDVNLNHGSYGSPPLAVIEAKEKLARQMEAFIDVYMRRKIQPMLVDVRKQLARLLNADTDEVVLVPNATHGVNTVAVNMDWKDGDVIVVCASLGVNIADCRCNNVRCRLANYEVHVRPESRHQARDYPCGIPMLPL